MRRISLLVLMVLLVQVGFPMHVTYAASDEVGWLLSQLNCLRQSLGVGPLTLNPALSTSAGQQSTYLSNHRVTDPHVQPDGSTPLSRANAAGFKGWVGENVSGGPTAERAFAWWQSDGIHYQNMTDVYWSDVGIGIASGSNGTWYTLDFGTQHWKANRITPAACGNFAPSVSSAANPTQAAGSPSRPIASQTPAITVGQDANGNLTYQIQDGDTLGQIALMFGYTWADIPTLLKLNKMTETDFRKLRVGSTFLIPAKNGTFTPVPVPVAVTPTIGLTMTLTASSLFITSVLTATLPVELANAFASPTETPTQEISTDLIASAAPTASPMPQIVTQAQATTLPSQTSDISVQDFLPWAIAANGVVIVGLFVGALFRRQR